MHTEDTIAAISTPPGHGGIGIVRISGSNAQKIAGRIFLPAKKNEPDKLTHRRIVYGHIVDPGSNETIDEVLISVMKAPHTYTREDIVEINCHGGPVPLRRILELVLASGARLAGPGEFTQRAFLNGRIDLAQAEAVIDMINALTEEGRKAAARQLSGGLSRKLEALREDILMLTALVEAHIDFPEEDIGTLSLEDMKDRAANIKQTLKKLIDSSRYGIILREGLKTAIIGRPNVGKSSLLNALLEHDRAIVTEMPGTTRDVIEEYLNISGIPVKIMDTAGIRDVENIAEKEGVRRSLMAMQDADLVLLVLDGSERLHDTDRELISKAFGKNAIFVINKTDLREKIDPEAIFENFSSEKRGQEGRPGNAPLVIRISARSGTGLDKLKIAIAGTVADRPAEGTMDTVTNMRHVRAIQKAHASVVSFIKAARKGASPELLSVDLHDALSSIGDIIGTTTPDDILNRIFSSFCIGK